MSRCVLSIFSAAQFKMLQRRKCRSLYAQDESDNQARKSDCMTFPAYFDGIFDLL